MGKLPLIARLLLGAIFLVFGLNGFLNFIHTPPMPERAGAFIHGLLSTGYFFSFLKSTEVVCGALLLIGVFVPLALVVLAPIVINIILFHLFLAPSGLPLAGVIGALMIYLGLFSTPYSDTLRKIFRVQ
jgi:putative oxidoreductase